MPIPDDTQPPRPPRRGFRRAVWFAVMASAFTATHLPPSAVSPVTHWFGDAALHTFGYFVLGCATAWMLVGGPSRFHRRTALVCLMSLLLYAAADEWTQPWFGRSCELRDWLCDATGTILAVGGWALARQIAPPRSERS